MTTPQSAALAEEIEKLLNDRGFFYFTRARIAALLDSHVGPLVDALKPFSAASKKIHSGFDANKYAIWSVFVSDLRKAESALATEPSGAKAEPISTKGGESCASQSALPAPALQTNIDTTSVVKSTDQEHSDASKRAGNVPPEPRADNEATPEVDAFCSAVDGQWDVRFKKLRGLARTIQDQRDAAIAERDELLQWKDSMLRVTPPMQEIGKALGLRLGESIHDKILPGILALRAELSTLKAQGK